MAGNRDDFTEATKRILANRSDGRCNFPSCPAPTVGPSSSDSERAITLGEAAHITGAAAGGTDSHGRIHPHGPRYDAQLSVDERRSAANGIWMCRPHARLIDADYENYSADTLRLWKEEVELAAGEALRTGVRAPTNGPSTLVSIGFSIIFFGRWVKGGELEWRFECLKFLRGTEQDLLDEVAKHAELDPKTRFVVVESQGDGRMLNGIPSWERTGNALVLILPVQPRAARADPKSLGKDLALSPDGDLLLADGDLGLVSGMENAIQRLSTTTGTLLGERAMRPRQGSLCALYFHEFQGNLPLLGRLLRLEFARLATIPPEGGDAVLNFVWRVDHAEVASSDLSTDRRLQVIAKLEWANGEHWAGIIPVFIHEKHALDGLPAVVKR